MKADIHPSYSDIKVTCSCGNEFQTRSTLGDDLAIEVHGDSRLFGVAPVAWRLIRQQASGTIGTRLGAPVTTNTCLPGCCDACLIVRPCLAGGEIRLGEKCGLCRRLYKEKNDQESLYAC